MRLQILILAFALMVQAKTIEFNRDVRPILSDNCFGCHGPDAVNKKIPLRLDSEAEAKRDLGGRRAVREGDPATSEMIRRITTDKKAMRMPPLSTGHTLSETQIATLREWIEQGANWQKHWAFLPPVKSPNPAVRNTSWPRNSIDYFVLERLEREGLQASPRASKETLLRRVSLDLTGLIPTPAEIDAFVNDSSPKAYEKVVDRLLASPRYGERMAIRWLDAARYADTNGYQYDGERVMWRWRDWVIEAFNQNKPYDQFMREQIAGDLLPNAKMEQKLATGFNRNHRANTEDGIIPEEYAVEYVVDRVETTSAVFMGLTMGCARCHNHKYDPITQKEFYQFFAYFNNVPELGRAMKYGNSPPLIPAPTREQQSQLEQLQQKIQASMSKIAHKSAAIDKAQGIWEKELQSATPRYWRPYGLRDISWDFDGDLPAQVGKPAVVPGRLGKAVSFDGESYLQAPLAGQFDIDERFSISGWFNSQSEKDCSIFARMSDSPTGKGYGLHIKDGKLFVTMTSNWNDDAIRYQAADTIERNRWYHVALTYTGSRMAEGLTLYVNGKPSKVTVLLDTLYRPFRNAGREYKEPFRIGAGNGKEQRFRGQIDDISIYGRVLTPNEVASLAMGESLNEIARKPAASRTENEIGQLRSYFLSEAAPTDIREEWSALNTLQLDREKLERTFPTVMVMAESPVQKQTHILQRGQYDKPGDVVQPGLPAVLPALPDGAPNNRLGLAAWLASPQNPLPSRVMMNRVWQMLFGTGLVKTSEDFGTQGEWPSNRELLDWLAADLVESGWNLKQMVKTIVTSSTYMQSSKETPELLQRDPDNRLLARGPRVRMPAEMVRDNALFAAGLLRERLGGPSVKPYQPAGLWQELVMQDMDYVQSKGADLYRRSLYTFWKRTVSPPMMANFDSALREACTVRENRTNTPMQALNLMNDVTFVEAARFIGQRMMKESNGDADARLSYGFRLVNSRFPTAEESKVLRASLQYHRDYFSSKSERASAFLKQGDSPPDTSLNPPELAAYASVASLMLNLDEAITKE